MKYTSGLSLALVVALALPLGAAQTSYVPPASPRATFNFNPGWKFIRENVTNAEQAAFDDSKWSDVSAPHTWNDTDSYDELISHGSGERRQYMGVGWYRKHFKLPAGAKDGKVFLELEGLKHAGRFWVNGKFAGRYENGVTPCGLDLTELVNFGEVDNVIVVKVDNSNDYREEDTGVGQQWMGRAFNPNYGGLNRNLRLHLTGKVYQTLPLYENLKTTGCYIYGSNFSVSNRTCEVTVESQVRNESGDPQAITLAVVVVDVAGKVCAKFFSEAADLISGQTEILSANGKLADAKFWSDVTPDLYDVYCQLLVNDKVVDVQQVKTGFRKTDFKGGVATGGVYLNEKFTWLTGYAQRSSDSWAGLGQAFPDWMHDYNAALMRSTHANYVRWMHIAPQAVDVRACDKIGIVQVCPAGDKEGDPVNDRRLQPAAAARQWAQRAEVMRATIIYFRNHPSILFWEAGNQVVTVPHMEEMLALRKQWDPHGGRVMGTRHGDNDEAATALTPISEWYGVMIGQDRRTDELQGPATVFRGYSAERRDRAPLIETEDFREEAGRRFWDDFSPPHFGFKKGPQDSHNLNSETFAIAAAARYNAYFQNRISNPDPAHSKWSGYASIYWSDANADGRQQSSEVCRVSGKVDAVRLPKQIYYVHRVMQSEVPDLHILGHWNYPTNTVKTIHVAASHCESVELFVNGKSLGKSSAPRNGYIFQFPDIKFEPGTLKAIATAGGKIVGQQEIKTAGEPKKLKLTPHVGPDGLQADGADVAFFDVEVVDANGQRCPTDEERVVFEVTGPAIWRGGYNSGRTNSVNNLWLYTECGINRVAIRATSKPGVVTLKALRKGLVADEITVQSKPVEITGGLSRR